MLWYIGESALAPIWGRLGEDESFTIQRFMFNIGVDSDDPDAVFHPSSNGILALAQARAVIDGWNLRAVPDGSEPEQPSDRDRILSVELADEMMLTPLQLADALGWAGVHPKSIRFPRFGVTKGYYRKDLETAWDEVYGDFDRGMLERILEARPELRPERTALKPGRSRDWYANLGLRRPLL
jgi:hypothetical protein